MLTYKKNGTLSLWKELELGLGSGSKFEVLLQMILNPNVSFTKYRLVKATGLRTPAVTHHLKTLIELGWIKEYRFSPVTYQINLENLSVKCIQEFLSDIKNLYILKS